MYRGKHQRRYSRRSNKSLTLLVSFVLILALSVSGTVAFLVARSNAVDNKFTPSQVTTSVVENLSENTKSNVVIKNTGDTDAFIRAAVVVTWKDENGNVYGEKPVAGTDYTIKIGDGWKLGADNFYYYSSTVAAGKPTGALIESCSTDQTKVVGTGNNAITYYLSVEIIGSGIQNKPANVFNTEWESSGLKVNDEKTDPMQWTLVNK